MTLSSYHQRYSDKSDEEIKRRADVKEQELVSIFQSIPLRTHSNPVRLAVLGCGDKRFIPLHKKIFEHVLQKTIDQTTFDITDEHLAGASHVMQHDCALPLPHAPYDITYGHVLLRFLETEKQFIVLQHSFAALKSGGIAIHILDREDYETEDPRLPNGLWSVPLNKWKEQLRKLHIQHKEIPIQYGLALVLVGEKS